MCKGRARLAGILRARQAERQAEPQKLYGAQGLVLIEYTGQKEGELPATVYTGIRYPYYPGREFYVDANDCSRVLSWKENGTHVFRQANGKAQ
jgi:hypothetical protein